MRRWLFPIGLLAGLLALVACAAQEKAAPAAPAAAPAAKPAWEEEWERVLAAAKREGKVVVAGTAGTEERKAATEGFEKKYGISVEYLGSTGAEYLPRIKAEREAGQYLWDVHFGGTTNMFGLKGLNALDPMEPALILPELKDPKTWRGDKPIWIDKERQALCFIEYTRPSLFINTNMVRSGEIKSFKDLLEPRWKGKILIGRDPRVGGPGQATFTFFYLHKELGPDYIRALARQDLTLQRADRQAAEWLAQGRFPVVVGSADRFYRDLMKQGLPVEIVDPRTLREGGDVSCGSGSIAMLNRAPHPNAAKLYLNWFLTKEAQTAMSRAQDRTSARLDVPTDHLEPWSVPQPGYINTATEEANQMKETGLLPLLREVLGR